MNGNGGKKVWEDSKAARLALKRQKILIVDDRSENLFALRKTLADLNTEIIEATNGNDALAATLDHRFAVAILDVMMPGMNGYELAGHLRGDKEMQSMPIVFLTASLGDEHHMFQGYEAGGIDYMVKPFNPEILRAKIKVFLELDRHKQELRLHRDHLETLVAKRTAMLVERVKEVRCLYAISKLVAEPGESIDETMMSAVNLIPTGWPHPEVVCGRIIFENREYFPGNFRETPWKQSTAILLSGEAIGRVDVFFTQERPELDEDPLLNGEGELLDEIARQLGVIIHREKALARERHLDAVLNSIRNVNQLIVHEKNKSRLLQAVCDNLTSSRGFQGAWIVLIDDDSGRTEGAQSGIPGAAFAHLLDRFGQGERPECSNFRQAKPDANESWSLVPSCLDCPRSFMDGKNWSLTVEFDHGERRYGYLGVLLPLQLAALEEEVSLLKDIAGDIAFALRGIEAEKEKDDLQQQLLHAQKMESLGTLAGGVGHDFNNLLQAITGYTQLLIMDKNENNPDFQKLKEIELACARAGQLVRQLLLFSRKMEAERRPLKLNEEVEQTWKLLERTLPKMIDISLHLDPNLWMVKADPVQIEQTLFNLCTNAADAMPDGGALIIETQNITLDEEYAHTHLEVIAGDYVQLTVTDTGHGMDRQTMEHIFDPFFTTKEFGKGTGLGLASVYGIVKGNGGAIICYSEVGQGTTFKIYLPAIKWTEKKEPRAVLTEKPRGGHETILLVDDVESIREVASQALIKFGYSVLMAASGEEALDIYSVKGNQIDLIIMDIGMPGMGGHRCLQELLQMDPAATVLIASGYSVNGQLKRTMEAGAAGFVGKPYKLSDLLNKVREVLDDRKRRTQVFKP